MDSAPSSASSEQSGAEQHVLDDNRALAAAAALVAQSGVLTEKPNVEQIVAHCVTLEQLLNENTDSNGSCWLECWRYHRAPHRQESPGHRPARSSATRRARQGRLRRGASSAN